MTLGIDKHDLEEIKRNYDKLASWLTGTYASFNACAFALQSLMNAVDKAEEELNDN